MRGSEQAALGRQAGQCGAAELRKQSIRGTWREPHRGGPVLCCLGDARRSDWSSAAALAGSRSSVSCSNRWAAYTRSIGTMVIRSPSISYSTR